MNAFAQHFFEFVHSVKPGSRLRLAPTPSGFLHQGNAINFILNWLAARYQESPVKLFLRIDDLDNDRKRPEFVEDIYESLQWLALDWDDAPILQSAHIERYTKVLEALRAKELLFPCQKSRRDLEPFEKTYPLEFRNQALTLDTPAAAWRIKTPSDLSLQDFVVRRRDGIPAYQVASFSDDVYFGTTHIIRGEDLIDSTSAQQYLATVLSSSSFLKIDFLHHPLLLDAQGEKLSKSAGSTALKTMREAGAGPSAIYNRVGQWLGLQGDSAQELLHALREKLG